jgi:hypothetical protein
MLTAIVAFGDEGNVHHGKLCRTLAKGELSE